MLIRLLTVMGLLVLAGCATPKADAPLPPMGDFRLGYNIVQARDVQQGPFSRDATAEELTGALQSAIQRQLGGYDGDGLYHLGIAIGAYVLAQPGLPVVYTPKSVLIFEVNIYDNATRKRLNDKPHRITAFEGLRNVAPVVGSGIVRGKDAQLANLADEGARAVLRWMRENPDWFVPDPSQPRVPFDRATAAQLAADAIAAQPPVPAKAK
ncbi:lipoprotein, putative [Oceaniovalibus guishaninsula JLT2003]|uniref:Lipoprotein, putative n=1 Tax=Oceaniovalibus guishaninsula JLT2003 TaxID=1231392 RepID=K2I3J7_9RHOB|nr:hypothetical protein [Oceaniovalibus guishaninsula]EKE43465.1 lipoprotein, putative [Oceaniovalibus guishaninsula JLT2003]